MSSTARRLRPRSLPPAARDLLVVLGCSWLVRAVVIATWPKSAHSDDLDSWMTVAHALRAGTNPYVTTQIVKWPPFALVVVFLIDHAARAFDISFFLAMRLTLIAAESAIVVVLYLMLRRFASAQAVRWLLIAGISLNPMAILFVCQHENIDVFVGLFVALALWALVVYIDTDDSVAWLAACLAIGLGVLTKTIPLVLAPVLAPGLRAASKLGRTLGAALFLGPAALGVSVVFVLAPRAVFDNVFRYRSISGYFGVTGYLGILHLGRLSDAYGRLFTVVMFLVVAALFVAAWRRGLGAGTTVLLAGLLLAAIPALGPGYAPQYGYWYIPPLLATYLLLDVGWRRVLLAFYVVAAATYVIEYAFVGALGSYLVAFFDGSSFVHKVSDRLSTPHAQTIVRTPLFVMFLVLLVEGCRRLWALRSGPDGLPADRRVS
jgi:Dolichyl-phosphate-mannose-protein mannosyltransferase